MQRKQKVLRKRKVSGLLSLFIWYGVVSISLGALLLFDNLIWSVPLGAGAGGVIRWG